MALPRLLPSLFLVTGLLAGSVLLGSDAGLPSAATTVSAGDEPLADLSLQNGGSVGASQITYTVTVTNLGPDGATAVTVVDTFSANQQLASVEPSQGDGCTAEGNVITCQLGDLASGETATIGIVMERLALDGEFSSFASVSANEADPDDQNNGIGVVCVVEPNPVYPLYEGWNPVANCEIELPGPEEARAFLSAAIDPDVWLAVALFDGEHWQQLFHDTPLPAFQTLGGIEAGVDVWIHTTGYAVLDYYP